MALKFTILLLSCIIFHNSVSQPTDYNEAMLESFKLVSNYYYDYYGVNANISQSQFLEFVGNNDNNLQCVKDYWTANSDPEKRPDEIYFKEFSELVPLICKSQENVKEFLEKRIATAAVQYAYNFACDYYNFGIVREYLQHLDFLFFVGKDEHLRCVEDYWIAKSVTSYQQTKIDLEQFTGLVNRICSEKKYIVKDFLEKRIEAAKAIHNAFGLAYDYYHVKDYFRQSQFLDFVGNSETNVQCVNNYWDTNSVPTENQDTIYFREFTDILYWICSKQKFDLIKLLNNRMEILRNKKPLN